MRTQCEKSTHGRSGINREIRYETTWDTTLPIAKADGRYPKLLREYAKPDLLILDDWGLINLNDDSRRDLLEILDDRRNRKSTLVTSQLPPDKWHDYIGEPTLADAILDRLVHNAYKINPKGESMRKNNPDLTTDTTNK